MSRRMAIAWVNRVFKDKPGGLVVDYLGLAHEWKQALASYTESGGKGQTAIDQGEAVAVMLETPTYRRFSRHIFLCFCQSGTDAIGRRSCSVITSRPRSVDGRKSSSS
jgi:hypothetical protein